MYMLAWTRPACHMHLGGGSADYVPTHCLEITCCNLLAAHTTWGAHKKPQRTPHPGKEAHSQGHRACGASELRCQFYVLRKQVAARNCKRRPPPLCTLLGPAGPIPPKTRQTQAAANQL